MRDFKGDKYEETKDLDIKEIAKLVKSELKDVYHDCKFSVRIDRYSMGQSIGVDVISTPFECYMVTDRMRFTEKGLALHNFIKKTLDQYNYDYSDSMTDYYDVNFYSQISLPR